MRDTRLDPEDRSYDNTFPYPEVARIVDCDNCTDCLGRNRHPRPHRHPRLQPTAPVRTGLREALELHLRHEPTKVSKSRIKRLRGLSQPQYRLRVGDIRVFYDVTETQVQVLAVVTKADAQAWLDEQGTPITDNAEGGGSSGDQG